MDYFETMGYKADEEKESDESFRKRHGMTSNRAENEDRDEEEKGEGEPVEATGEIINSPMY